MEAKKSYVNRASLEKHERIKTPSLCRRNCVGGTLLKRIEEKEKVKMRMIVVRVYESLSTTATCVLSSLPPCHYVHVGACECACMCAILSTKISGRCDNIYIRNIYIHGTH